MFKKDRNSTPYDYMIVGLGNPGEKYSKTRHNVGFMCVNVLCEAYGNPPWKKKDKSLYCQVSIGDKRCLLVKPQTFMNLSGQAVSKMISFFKIPFEKTIIILDDVLFDVGQLRIRRNGSHGGHNGMKNIIECNGSESFPRLKIGVGKKPHPDYDLASWVLSEFKSEDLKQIKDTILIATQAIEFILINGLDDAMNKFNR